MGPMSIAGTGLGVIGSISQSQAQASNLQNAANTANYNASVQRQQADQAMISANSQANLQAKQARAALGEQRAAGAQNNAFGVTSTDLINQSAANAELDRLNILYGGQTKAMGLDQAANMSDTEANWLNAQVGPTKTAGLIGAGSTALTGYGKYNYLQSGAKVGAYEGF